MPPSSSRPHVPIAPAVSVSLDLMRFSLATIVVLGHLTQPAFQNAWPNLTGVAVASVGGFFVLSGYTIRSFTPSAAAFDVRRFFVDRATRLLSLTLIALVATLALDAYSSAVAPAWYGRNWGAHADHPVLRIAANALLVNEVWGIDVSPLSNSPFWSLGYEAGFYAIWGALLFCRRTGRALVIPVAVALLYGPDVIAMLPFWLAGVLIHDWFATSPSRRTAIVALAVSLPAALGVAASHKLTELALTPGIDRVDAMLRLVGCPPARVHPTLVSGSLIFVFLLVALLAALSLAGSRVRPGTRLVAFARKLGDATFPLYLLHFPLLVAIGATVQGRPLSSAAKLLVLASLTAMAFAVVPLGNRVKDAMRAFANRKATVAPVRGVAGADDAVR
ncbi:MAG TPA: acyltransferase [Paraburkholderia sp.]|jgi:peptidoglycan/LPS O-acetylase OafA/YrhL|nr:acyltransferase [Paraburkholderia sp.]